MTLRTFPSATGHPVGEDKEAESRRSTRQLNSADIGGLPNIHADDRTRSAG